MVGTDGGVGRILLDIIIKHKNTGCRCAGKFPERQTEREIERTAQMVRSSRRHTRIHTLGLINS